MIKVHKGHISVKGTSNEIMSDVLSLLADKEVLKLFIDKKIHFQQIKEVTKIFSFKDYLKEQKEEFDELACDKFLEFQKNDLELKMQILDELINCSSKLLELTKDLPKEE